VLTTSSRTLVSVQYYLFMRLGLVLASTEKKQHFLLSCIVMSNTYLLVDQMQLWGVFQFF